MKIKSILVAGAVGLTLAGSAFADPQQPGVNYVYITGSTAFRPAAFLAISNLLYSVANPSVTISTYKPTGAATNDPTLASFDLFSNTVAGTPTIVKAAWSGSEAGIIDATDAATQKFLSDSFLNGPAGVTTINQNAPSATDLQFVDIAFADNDQSHSRTTSPSLASTFIGVIPFVWVKNTQTNPPASYNAITNVTDPQLRVALNGSARAGLITGNVGDSNFVYVAGRDFNSGTRVNTLLDTQYGIANSAIKQIIIQADGSDTNYVASSGGQSSGGTLATTLTYPGTIQATDAIHANNGGYYAIAYLGLYDADAALGINTTTTPPTYPAVQLTYNGVNESSNAVVTGQYSFWGKEYIYQGASASTTGAAFYTSLVGEIPSHADGLHTFATTTMHATKTTSASDPLYTH